MGVTRSRWGKSVKSEEFCVVPCGYRDGRTHDGEEETDGQRNACRLLWSRIYTPNVGKTDGKTASHSNPMCHIAHHLGETGSASASSLRIFPDVRKGKTRGATVGGCT